MPSFTPQRAAWYLALLAVVWIMNAAGTATASTSLSCGPDGCQTPTYPLLFAAGFAANIAFAVLAYRVARENDPPWPPYEPWQASPLQPMFRSGLWWLMVYLILLFGIAIPAAIKTLRRH